MNIITLTPDSITEIYETHMRQDFPASELKPLAKILAMYEKQLYHCYAMLQDKKTVAYAFFSSAPESGYLLLDYYAVCAEYRNSGLGSQFFPLLKQACADKSGFLAEVENPAYISSDEEQDIANRRIEFYKRNGWLMTSVASCLFDVEFLIIQLPFKEVLPETEVRNQLRHLYQAMFSDASYHKYVVIR